MRTLMPSRMKFTSEIYKSVNRIPGIHDNGPPRTTLWRLTLTAYSLSNDILYLIWCMLYVIPVFVNYVPRKLFYSDILVAESQKGVNAVQRCSVENQKGAITNFHHRLCTAITPFWLLNRISLNRKVRMPFWRSTDDIKREHCTNYCIRHNFRVQIFSRFWTRCGNSGGLNFAIFLMFSLL